MRNLAEESVSHHFEYHHLVCAVAAVLENDAMLASSLGGIHQVPAFLQRGGGRHFDGGMFAVLHHVTAIGTCQFQGVAM